jgi:hypothetical protein
MWGYEKTSRRLPRTKPRAQLPGRGKIYLAPACNLLVKGKFDRRKGPAANNRAVFPSHLNKAI